MTLIFDTKMGIKSKFSAARPPKSLIWNRLVPNCSKVAFLAETDPNQWSYVPNMDMLFGHSVGMNDYSPEGQFQDFEI